MDKIFYVYQLRISDEDLPFYVGKGQGDRAHDHLKPRHLKSRTFKNHVINKALKNGKDIFVEFIERDMTEDDALSLEVYIISAYGRRDIDTGCLTNKTDGGEGVSGFKVPEDLLYKWRDRRHSDEVKRLISDKTKGDKHPRYGKTHTAEAIEKFKEINSGESNPFHGKTHSDESKRRIREGLLNQVKIICPYCERSCTKATLARYHKEEGKCPKWKKT